MRCRRRLLTVLVVLCCCARLPLLTPRADARHAAATLARLRVHALSVTVCSGGACPFSTIQAALDSPSVAPGATVSIVPGIYREHLLVRKPITLQRDPSVAGTAPVIISGGAGGSGVTVTAGTQHVLLHRLNIRGNSDLNGNGGGVLNFGSLTVTDSMINANSASSGSGYNPLQGGGGIYNAGTMAIVGSTITGNSARLDLGGGGGIYNAGAMTIVRSTVSGNRIDQAEGGGGIYNSGALRLQDSVVSNNQTQGSSPPAGGGIENTGTVTDTGTLIITGSTISGNQAIIGGGIYDHATLTITNSTITGNQGGWPTTSAWGGGGLWIDNGAVATVTSSTISANASYGAGGGICGPGRLVLVDSIVAGNTDTVAPDLDAVVTGGHSNLLGAVDVVMGVRNNVAGNRVGSLQHPLNPLLGPLGNHGGPTPTMALRPGSPALHLGTACPLTDQRGRRRPHAPAHCDAGAYEASARG